MPKSPCLQPSRALFPLILVSALLGCGETAPPPVEAVRAIRTITVAEPASGKMRRFSGVVEAATQSSLSFEVSGNVQEINVNVGDRISKGQILARLDEKTFQLKLEAAQATLARVQVELEDAQRELERLQEIAGRDRGLVSQQMLDQAQANADAARKNLSYTNSRLNLAKRDLERTALRAPFDGVVAQRHVDPFEEVDRGQRLFDVHVAGAMEAAIRIPESEIELVYLGLPGEIRFPAIPGETYEGLVTEISNTGGAANAFPVRLTIQETSPRIRPGLTTEVSLMLGGDPDETAYLIPISALLSAQGETAGFVFVFDAETSTVKKTAIEHGGIRDNNLIVEKGLDAGDIVAVAGVSFLGDGQPVRLMRP